MVAFRSPGLSLFQYTRATEADMGLLWIDGSALYLGTVLIVGDD